MMFRETNTWMQVVYGRLLIATGVRPRRIADNTLDNKAKGLQVGSQSNYSLCVVL